MDLEDKGNFMELNWGNILHFNSEKDYYEVLGFLSKEEELIRCNYGTEV